MKELNFNPVPVAIPTKIKVKADLMIEIRDFKESYGLTQLQLASVLKVHQPRVSQLISGEIHLFSCDMLYDFKDMIDRYKEEKNG